ncbi:MAG: nucleoside deaminase [Bacilli bacterium]|nr:nucleoside deaminase [Erysipelotrichaceae bacterium]MDD6249458.1 nucleoside deaminase [Bacillales bacterium]MDY6141850.1 nucleoside deaminase [Bacilli bacterium]
MNKFMEMAIEEAKKGILQGHGGPFGCVIVKNDEIVGKGHNEVLKNNDPTCHGEIMAIHEACKTLNTFDLTGCEVYTTGEPCPMCLAAILWANIEKVYYGCNIFDTEKIGFRDNKFYKFQNNPSQRQKMIKELDRDQCLKLYDLYNSLTDKKQY